MIIKNIKCKYLLFLILVNIKSKVFNLIMNGKNNRLSPEHIVIVVNKTNAVTVPH